jgi:hypothetical protein
MTDGKGKTYYFNAKQRNKIYKKGSDMTSYTADSHASIAAFYKINEDNYNKYEFNKDGLRVDNISWALKDDSRQAERWVRDFVKTSEFENLVFTEFKERVKCNLSNRVQASFLYSEDLILKAVKMDPDIVGYIESVKKKPSLRKKILCSNLSTARYLEDVLDEDDWMLVLDKKPKMFFECYSFWNKMPSIKLQKSIFKKVRQQHECLNEHLVNFLDRRPHCWLAKQLNPK